LLVKASAASAPPPPLVAADARAIRGGGFPFKCADCAHRAPRTHAHCSHALHRSPADAHAYRYSTACVQSTVRIPRDDTGPPTGHWPLPLVSVVWTLLV